MAPRARRGDPRGAEAEGRLSLYESARRRRQAVAQVSRWLQALGILLGLALLQGILDPANETDAQITAEAASRALAAKESLPPEARFEHPLRDCTWHANWGPGEKPQPRCYIPRSER